METDYSHAADDLKIVLKVIRDYADKYGDTLYVVRAMPAIDDAKAFLEDTLSDLQGWHEKTVNDLEEQGGYLAAMRTQAIIEDRRGV